ncbi:hypothetical protein R3P38DRAFT_2475765, partial [Favolaschia claudopus]
INNNHWIAFAIDLDERAVGYGDSYGRPRAATQFIPHVMKWLDHNFGARFRNTGDTLRHPEELDYIHCGIYTADTIEHAVFDAPLASFEECRRVRW